MTTYSTDLLLRMIANVITDPEKLNLLPANTPGLPPIGAVRGDADGHGKELHQYKTCHESSDVSPYGDTSLTGAWHQPTRELQECPIEQHDPGGSANEVTKNPSVTSVNTRTRG